MLWNPQEWPGVDVLARRTDRGLYRANVELTHTGGTIWHVTRGYERLDQLQSSRLQDLVNQLLRDEQEPPKRLLRTFSH